jgi:hypothetical protein
MSDPAKSVGLWLGQQLVTTYVLGPLAVILPPAAIITFGWGFITSSHTIPGWAILGSSGLGGLLVFSVGLNLNQWRKTRRRWGLTVVAHGGEHAFLWQMNTSPRTGDEMVASGLYDITDRTGVAYGVSVPKAIIEISYWLWHVVPLRHRTESPGPTETVPAWGRITARISFHIRPPVVARGKPFRARVALVDSYGRHNWSERTTWKYAG